MIKVKLSEIVGNVENLKALQEVKLPVRISYRISRLISKINPILDSFNEKRNSFIKELGMDDGQGNVSIPKEDTVKLQEFAKKLEELLSIEETIDWFEPIAIDDLGEVSVEPKLLVHWIFA